MTNGSRAYAPSRFSNAPSEASVGTTNEKTTTTTAPIATTATVQQYPYMWDTKDPDLDDALHNPDPVRDAALDRSCAPFSSRGWVNASALFLICGGIIVLFAAYPIIDHYVHQSPKIAGFNLGGVNGSGQVPQLTNFPNMIDSDTPQSARTRTGLDGKSYSLVFSDEFNQDGRTFYPGDDPFWEAVDLHYWPTVDLEWYDPSTITTQNGKLVITMTETPNHELDFMSGMLQSWNKLCFTTGYIEVSVSMPGSPQAPGLWPAAWTMGNLGRAGYGATTEGTWPYSYDSCDLGTFPNQTDKSGNPAVAATGGKGGTPLSFMPGQKLSACTCPNSDHPGPSVNVGRGVPEIDIFETQIDVSRFQAEVSQSYQTAPYNYQYEFVNTSDVTPIYDTSITKFNTYKGGVYQQAISAVTDINNANYNDQGYAVYGYEWWSNSKNRDEGFVTWVANGQKTWTMTADTIGPDSTTEISARMIPEEPMYIIFNLGMSPGFQAQDFKHLTFPVSMYIDYVRVYQRNDVIGEDSYSCDPQSHPTADYINNHLNAYSNPNLTTWDQAGYTYPRNSKYDGC
ncbi:glycoside hydrolase family 16 protein [Dichomitus squalens LYAD-421 SS1]|uniref:Glycoside hydrolase family 16 protein n=1 Tax=Dichomitus squalens (strain LYAD-421) TaxID=732165 RepID=R7SKL6_DICSQ|nr:glycoside hydrolase family 16 protein [Dichomitus squalens LYAD-421 SS1]EJF56666.1 glycoside hydrolase family 16 protein [Dichomitus squalens LYAD-421 SS1]